MTRQTLKDSRYRIIGYIDTDSSGKQTARDHRFRIVGYYEPSADITRNAHFTIVGHGNLLASLISCG